MCTRSPQYHPTVSLLLALALSLVGFTLQAAAQDIRLDGFVKSEYMYDTRQVVQVREGQFNLFPEPWRDADGDDLDDNDTHNLLFAAFQSRMALIGSGTEVLGANLTGHLEADFFGAVNADVSEFRLRHAFVRLDWQKHQLLLGQYWSPLFTIAVFPQVTSFNTGAPFQPFARFPQIRYTYKPGPLQVIAVLSQQRDAFQDIGGRKMQQQAGLPAAHLHLQYVKDEHVVGAGGYVKSIRPTLQAERFTAGTVQAYARLSAFGAAARAKITYGSDLTDHLMTGGFITTTNLDYKPLRVLALWTDLMTTGKPWSLGLFGGYLTNRGCGSDVTVASTNARTPDMQDLWRIAPRVSYSVGALRFAFELETTRARYASSFDTTYKPECTDSDEAVTNIRGLFAAYYFF